MSKNPSTTSRMVRYGTVTVVVPGTPPEAVKAMHQVAVGTARQALRQQVTS